jgi:hypothetical protein
LEQVARAATVPRVVMVAPVATAPQAVTVVWAVMVALAATALRVEQAATRPRM